MNKVFPIKTETACRLKWSWSTVFLSAAKTASCHRVNQIPFTLEAFDDFHNLPKKLEDRKLMLDGKWPSGGCEYCEKIEAAGGTSDREMHLDYHSLGSPHELDNDMSAVRVTPTYLEVYFNNTCNMSCLYCGPYFSSQWVSENKKFGNFVEGGVKLLSGFKFNSEYDSYLEKLWGWLEQNGSHLKTFSILGGEPFYQEELVKTLDFWAAHPNPNLTIVVFSNLMVRHDRFVSIIEKFLHLCKSKCIKDVQLTASLDCWGPQQEYVRYGLDLVQWEENFNYILKQKWLRVQINNTITPLTIKTLPDLVHRLNQWRSHRTIFQSYMTAVQPAYMNPDIFGPGIFEDDLLNVMKILPSNSPEERSQKEYFIGLHKQIQNSKRNESLIKDLQVFLTEMDKRRNTDYKALFPWLEKEFEKNLIHKNI